MPLAFYPAEGQPEVQITGVGVAGANGLTLDRAATVMAELQKPALDDEGQPTGERVPLDGDELLAAAREWAERSGLIVSDGAPSDTPARTQKQSGTGARAAASDPKAAATVTATDTGADGSLEA